MLLIDADNLSADVIKQAVDALIEQHGAVHVRRAYCTAESAAQNQALFKKLKIRPVVNLALGKNSTDIALAVDAIDLVHSESPEVVVIASSDSDFAPLVMRLREKGCRVCGIGQKGKTGDEVPQAYDEFKVFTHGARPAAGKSGVAPPSPASKAPRRTATKTAPVAIDVPDEVQRIVKAVPELAGGDPVALNLASEKLRGAKLLAKTTPSTRLFRKHTQYFELSPERQPNRVRFRGA